MYRVYLRLLLFCAIAFSFNKALSQVNSPGGITCESTGPICSDNSGSFIFQNNNNPGTNIPNPIGCIGEPRRPAWFFLKIDQSGDLEFDIIQTSNSGFGLDVDFVCWGPFTSGTGNCNSYAERCLNSSGMTIACPDNIASPNFYTSNSDNTNIVDCSYSINSVESLTINGAVSGEFYLLLVTNFEGGDGTIEILQTNTITGSSGTTDCTIINVDGILGPDLDVCSDGTASTALNANPDNDPSFVGFNWEYDDGTGFVPISGTDGMPSVNVSNSGTYQVTITDADGNSDVDSIEVIFSEIPTANSINDQLICDDNNDGFLNFNLSELESFVLSGQSNTDFNITFHNSMLDADMNADALPAMYTNQVAYQEEIIFVRIENVANSACYDTTSFLIDVFDQPTAMPLTYELCDDDLDSDDTNGFVEFNLPSISDDVLNGQVGTQFTVTYHLNQIDAASGDNPLSNLYTNATVGTDQIFVRVENNDNSECYETAVINLVVNDLPVIVNSVDLVQCDDDSDGFSNFNLTEANTLISTNAINETFTYYDSPTNANNALSPINNFTAYTNTDPSSNPDILYVRVENNESCFRVAQLNLLVEATQIPQTVEILYEECDTLDTFDSDITNGITTFDFSNAEAQIRTQSNLPAGQNLTFTYYETEADALAEINVIPDISNHRNDASPFEQEIYVRVDGDLDNACVGLGIHVRLRTVNPTPNTDPNNLELCDDNNSGDLVEIFNLTQNEVFIFNGDPNVSATYYSSFTDANAGFGGIPNPNAYQNTDPTEAIYVRVTNSTTSCYAIVDFNISVNPLPEASIAITDFSECENNTDFRFNFDLERKTAEILNGQDPAQFTVTYHISKSDADNLDNPLPNPYPNISNPQPIFVAITNNNTGCSISTLSFNIQVNEGANANEDGEILLYEICDDVGENDGSAQFDLTTQNAEIYDSQNPIEYSLTYHDSMEDALNNVQSLPTLYENITNPQIVYARVSNKISPDDCFEIAEVTLQINLLPIFDLEERYILCLSSNGTEAVDIPPVIDTGLPENDYDFEWFLDGNLLTAQTGSTLIPTQGGIYSVIVTDTSTSNVTICANSDSTEVFESELPVLNVSVTSETFSGNNIITAVANTTNTNTIFEYNLDNGPWQDEGIFNDVSGGEHLITARDKNGCGFVSESILVIDYPLYFTPNGDGNNETWNITGIDTQPDAVIYIFDRYGKLLKQLSPIGEGWDGTFNGTKMPSSDYWFRLVYNEPLTSERKEFNAHFTLKR